MAMELTPDIQVRRDLDGRIRQLQHLDRPYSLRDADKMVGLTGDAPTPRTLAEAYLRDTAQLYDFRPSATSNFAAKIASAPTEAPDELRFKEEKATGDSVTVAYDQTALGLPVWDAGVSVRIDSGRMNVTGAHNATHYDLDVSAPPPDAPFRPNGMTVPVVSELLGLHDSEIVVNGTRSLIYRYDPAERIDPQVAAHENADHMTGFAGTESPHVPTLPLPPIPESIGARRHYVVTEVLFARSVEGWGPLNWRAFIEPQTGAVLYLRALIACARGQVFLTDPVTASGIEHSAADGPAVLDALRSSVPFTGLDAPTSQPPSQVLASRYVTLKDLDDPPTAMPSETSPFSFAYPCNTENFAACNAYYHCDAFFRMIDDMGLDAATYFNDTDFPVPVDPHAWSGRVNASAPGNVAGNGLGRLVFGLATEGSNFGIAADVRVVIHEFGHAVLWDHVSSPNFGWAHSPGDALGAILHDPESLASDRFETFPFMKNSAGLSRRHDRDVTDGWAWGGSADDTQYGSEQILSTTLFRVYLSAGGDSSELSDRQWASRYVSYLILKAVGLLSFTTRDPDVFVAALAEADATTRLFEGHPGGAFGKVFRWSFEQQGLYQSRDARRPVTQPGAPPEIDVYIDDGRRGDYLPYLTDFRGLPDVWNRRAADGGHLDEAPEIGVVNHAYATVRNRGSAVARDVTVRAYKSRRPGASAWPTDWKQLPTASIDLAQPVEPGAEVVVGPFDWTPEFEGEQLLFEVSGPGDRSSLERVVAGPIPNAKLVPLDNNLAQRAF